jgi:YbbR domain-containing protein
MSEPPRRRKRQDTLSELGRAPARTTRTAPPPDEGPERGAIRRWIHGALFDNVGLKFLSMVLAITVFLLVNTDRDREITVRVGVSYTLPDDRVLVSDRLDEVFVTIKGSWRRLRKFDARELERVNIDLRRAPSGDVPITPEMVHVPSELTVESIQPRSVRVAWDKRVERVVEVQPQVEGTPQHGYKVFDVKATPATIKVRGAEVAIDDMPPLKTQKVFVDGRAESFTATVDAVPTGTVEVVGSPQVQVHVSIDESLVNSKLADLKIGVRGDGVDPAKWTIDPPTIDVTLTGAELAVEKAKTTLAPVVKLSATDSKAHEVEVTVEGAPPGIGIKLSPGRVKVAPVK